MRIKLSDYILEQSISTSSAIDIELEQLVAEMDVCCKLAMAYNKQLLMEDFVERNLGEFHPNKRPTGSAFAGATSPYSPINSSNLRDARSTGNPFDGAKPLNPLPKSIPTGVEVTNTQNKPNTQPAQPTQATPQTNNQQQTNQQSNQQNTQQTNAKQGFFASVWGYIKRFFAWIGNKLTGTTVDAQKNGEAIKQNIASMSNEQIQQKLNELSPKVIEQTKVAIMAMYSPEYVKHLIDGTLVALTNLNKVFSSVAKGYTSNSTIKGIAKGNTRGNNSKNKIISNMAALEQAITTFSNEMTQAGTMPDHLNGKKAPTPDEFRALVPQYIEFLKNRNTIDTINQINAICKSLSSSVESFNTSFNAVSQDNSGNRGQILRETMNKLMATLSNKHYGPIVVMKHLDDAYKEMKIFAGIEQRKQQSQANSQ